MTFSVVFTPEAEEQLVSLYHYIAAAGSPEPAARYTDSIVEFCEDLAAFPHRGRARDDIRPRIRTRAEDPSTCRSTGPRDECENQELTELQSQF